MSVLRYAMFFLPIHHYNREIYYKRHRDNVEKEKEKLEEEWGEPFDKFGESTKRTWEYMWSCPPWKYKMNF